MQCTSLNMQRKPGFPVANCSIKMPDGLGFPETGAYEEENEQQQKRQQLINFGHAQWGFNNWNWAVTKQDLDFVELTNGKYCAGVVAFVSVSVKSFDLHRENIGYATSNANTKGFAIYKSRKCAVTNALRETLLSFGGSVATELLELLESQRSDLPTPVPLAPASVPLAPAPVPLAPIPVPLAPAPIPEPLSENNQNIANKNDIKNVKNSNGRKESIDNTAHNMRPHPVKNAAANAPRSPPVARAHPMPSTLPPANRPLAGPPRPAAPHPRPNPNVSFLLQPVMGAVQPLYPPPRPVLPQPLFPNYYEYAGPWHIAYEPYDRGNVNLNFNIPPKNLVVNSRSGSVECKSRAEGEALQYAAPQGQGCWIKPTIFYDGFWTEQKVKKWVAEQVEKQFPEDASNKSTSPGNPPDTAKS